MDDQPGTVVGGQCAQAGGHLVEERVRGLGRHLRPERVHRCGGGRGVPHRDGRHVTGSPVLERGHLVGIHPPRAGRDGHHEHGAVESAGVVEGVGGQPRRIARVEFGVVAVHAYGRRQRPVGEDQSWLRGQGSRVECPPQVCDQRAQQCVPGDGEEQDACGAPDHHGSASSTGAP